MRGTATFLKGADHNAEPNHIPTPEMDGVEFARQYLGFEPDAKQSEVLRAEGPRTIVNTTRMWGKSTVAAAKALHRAWTKPGQTVALVSARKTDSAALMRLTTKLAGRLCVTRTPEQKFGTGLGLRRGSWIVGLACGDAPVHGADLTIVDDAARVPDEAMEALRPAVAIAKGQMMLLSTPGARSGFFFRTWTKDASSEWVKISATAEECARLPPEFLEEEREHLAAEQWWKTYMCSYDDEAVRRTFKIYWLDKDGNRVAVPD